MCRSVTFTLSILLLALSSGGAAADNPEAMQTLEQNWYSGWKVGEANWYHHATQGGRILPYEMFMALEQPSAEPTASDPPKLFGDMEYLSRFGFLPGAVDEYYNPDGLPIGFAIDRNWIDPNDPKAEPMKVVGFTCAACHTGQITHKNVRLRIEGGSAMINIGAFQKAFGGALIQTHSSPQKLDAFVARVLALKGIKAGEAPAPIVAMAKKKVTGGLDQAVAKVREVVAAEAALTPRPVDAGYSRTDALSLIGNRVFGRVGQINVISAQAPVNYPHLWDTPWFYWVQYNGSIRLPMVRNIGEALGVGAEMNKDFQTTVHVENLHLMEDQLAGKTPFSGLRAPAWPEDVLGKIDGIQNADGKWRAGKLLYEQRCIHCHYRIEDYQLALKQDVESKEYKKYWSHPNKFERGYMKLPLINYVDIGTDPAAVVDFYQRIVYTGSLPGLPSTMSAVEALARVTIKVRELEFARLTQEEQDEYDGYRELDDDEGAVARLDYKARPLNGVWATAPFLHNGSVPNLYELLGPQSERSETFYLGSTEFDPVKVGFDAEQADGRFLMDTKLAGNRNTGHEFRDLTDAEMNQLSPYQREKWNQGKGWAVLGVVGKKLTDAERWALIEYVKSLGSPQPVRVIGKEYPSPAEPVFIKTLGEMQTMLQFKVGKERRGQHFKTHGTVKANFQVADDLKDELRIGLFSQAGNYDALIRFSNGDGDNDQDADVHGMAIKVFAPDKSDPEKTVIQDFLLADNPVFFAKDLQHLLQFLGPVMTAPEAQRTGVKMVLATTTHPALATFRKILTTSPLQAEYWSQTPYKFGSTAVKYYVTPHPDNAEPKLMLRARVPKNALREAMVERLVRQKKSASFDFWIQLQTDPYAMPIEDATVRWDSEPIKVATITIHDEEFASDKRNGLAENIAFSPWNALPEHTPLGGINRARRPIYQASQKLRHETNQVEADPLMGLELFNPPVPQ